MAKRTRDDLPLGALTDLLAWWRKARVKGMIIGGLAVSLVGRPRTTRDIDAIVFVDEKKWESFSAIGADHSFEPRLPDALEFARTTRVLLMRHEKTGVDADLSFGNLLFEREALARAKRIKVKRLSLPVPTPEDLIIMKAIAHRDVDYVDIAGLIAANPKLDVDRIRNWVDQFAQDLENPDLYIRLDKLLSKRGQNG